MNRTLAWLRHPWTGRIAAWILGATFLAAALPKIMDPPGFAEALHAYHLLPDAALAPFALALPWLELMLALALITGLARRSAGLLALTMLILFMGALTLNLAWGNPVDCGCFGTRASTRSIAERLMDMKLDLVRDGALLLLAAIALFAPQKDARP